jgi:hypothetical protein
MVARSFWFRFPLLCALALSASPLAGCGSNCDAACNKANDDGCTACDCNKCGQAPAGCDEYFDCIIGLEDTCSLAALSCKASPECQRFIDKNCN